VNCAALPATLVESELFGRERGAYTGALTRQAGRFEVADGSTLFLDEVAELPLELQAKLLRVLEDGEFERLGSTRSIKVDVRVVAATNRDLAGAVRKGLFREDLYYRLNVFPIVLPPLRDRVEDIPQLVWAFVEEFSEAMGKVIETIPDERMDALRRYPWPGNVRELRNVIERAMILARDGILPVELSQPVGVGGSTATALAEIERRHILSVLERTAWRVRGAGGAAALLDLKPTTLEARMKRLGVRRPGLHSRAS
jgi:formate hydrogenlyase transcriptional activator